MSAPAAHGGPALVLASSSPRRRDLLQRIGVSPSRIANPAIDENPLKGELPRAYALRLAQAKAQAVQRLDGEVVLAGDTTVALGRRILPPADSEAVQRQLLTLLSGRRHRCISAVCVIDQAGKCRTRIAETIVAFKRLSAAEIDAYVASGEGLGKAGGYAIQGRAEALVRFLSGSHSAVIGLPLFETRALLKASGFPLG
ncbi:MAG: septum formation protein Maf [Proteobacteria bacterium]|nr:septum formation protein Maf [Pseudomonadota bacterium]